MFKQGVKILVIFSLVFSFCVPLLVSANSAADQALSGLKKTATEGFGEAPSGTVTIPSIAGKLIGAVLAFIGVLFFGLMVYGGILWMIARGNEEQVTKAKDLIMAAIIGLIIVLSAYAITSFIGTSLTSTT